LYGAEQKVPTVTNLESAGEKEKGPIGMRREGRGGVCDYNNLFF